jgi:hypothetical protein
MDANIGMIENLGKRLSDIGDYGATREAAEMRSNQSFAIRWTCLSLLSIRKMLNYQQDAIIPLKALVALHRQDGLGFTETALMNARTIDEQFAAACGHIERLRHVREESDLYKAGEEDRTQQRITEILRHNESELLPILDEVESMEDLRMDESLSEAQEQIHKVTHNLIRKLPGVVFDDDDITGPTTVGQVLDFLARPVRPQFVYFSRLLRGLCGVNKKWSNQELREIDRAMQSIETFPRSLSQSRLMERQLWRLHDLCSGSFGFTLELYFLSVGKLLSTFSPPPRGIH